MSYTTLLQNLGFDSDPFAKTNADEEERLEQYFIPPPFFTAVYGDPNDPKSSIVFAPRGNGKTALKRKIEIASQNQDYLCITYNSFNITGKKLADIDQNYHLTNIIRLVLIAAITAAYDDRLDRLSKDDRHIIYLFVKKYLNDIEKTELKSGIEALKNIGDKAKDLWNKFTGPIGFVINALLNKIGLGDAEINEFESKGGELGSQIDQLRTLGMLGVKLGYKSIYILIDKVDENSLTSGATNSYAFISSVLGDLQLLELKGFAFKLFLWDLLQDEYREVARPDRVKYYSLNWEGEQLCTVLSKRLQAYSNDKISTLAELLDYPTDFPLDRFIAYFAQGSPRTLIRICKEILDHQAELNFNSRKISTSAVELGFEDIAENISSERYSPSLIKDLRKTKRCDFTIRHIYTNVFKFTQQAGMAKVRSWEDAGAVKSLGTIQETKGAKSSNHYGIADLLLAKTVFSDIPVFDFALDKLDFCKCKQILLRDWNINKLHTCEYCQRPVEFDSN